MKHLVIIEKFLASMSFQFTTCKYYNRRSIPFFLH